MSSQSFPIDSIWINPDTRQRKDLGDLSDLARSLASSSGLINPLVIKRDGELVTGERRLGAAKLLGWTHITVTIREDMTPTEWQRLEFDENAHRLDLTWQERSLAIARFHELNLELEGKDWSIEQSSERLGFSYDTCRRHIRVANALIVGDALVTNSPTFSTAWGICDRQDSRRSDAESERLSSILGGTSTPVLRTTNGPDGGSDVLRDSGMGPEPEPSTPILTTNFLEWAPAYRGPKFNLIHCDFPYGINADKHDQGAAASFGGYGDSPDLLWALLEGLAAAMDNVVAESAHLVFWFSPTYYSVVRDRLTAMGWRVFDAPLIWWRSDNSGILADPSRDFRRVYETAFFATRGDRKIVRAKANLIPAPNSKEFHMSEKPLDVCLHFLSALVDDTTRLLDPTCGSANSLIAARRLGAHDILGLELDPDNAGLARQNWRKHFDE